MKQALADAIADRGYTSLTPVQEAVGAPEHAGADMLVSAQTGSGKTLGFGIAIAPTLLGEAEAFEPAEAPLALVIAPTRELALQVKRELSWLYAKAGAVVASCVGGMDMRDERRALARGAHIVVATPGRLRDHILRGSMEMGGIRAIVLDEADEMLDLGFREELEFILGEAPEDRQTLLFSATVPPAIEHMAKSYQRDAVRIETKAEASQHADIEYLAMAVAEADLEHCVINVLRYYEAPNAIVFANTRATVGRITTRLANRGFKVVSLSGELSQQERTNALQAMRDGRARVCVATDVAARGIDLPNLDLVVHAELPGSHETLLHRSGRTGRAGRKGVSVLVVTPRSKKKALRVLGMAQLTAKWAEPPSAEAVQARDAERMLEDPVWEEAPREEEAEAIERLVETFSPEQLAAAFLRNYASQHSAPEELSGGDLKPRPREEFGASAWFSVSQGRNQGAEPRRLLPMLCKGGGLTRDDIGAIRVGPDESYVQVRESAVRRLLDHLGESMTVEGSTRLAQVDGLPDELNRPARGPKPGSKPDRKAKFDKPGKPKREPRPEHPRGEEKEKAPAPQPEPHAAPEPSADPKPARKPRHGSPAATYRSGASDPSAPMGAPRRKGPPPPPGKPSSKKNRARAADAAHGGEARPFRSGGKPGGKPAGKFGGKPGGGPKGKFSGKPGGKPGAGFKGKPGGKPGGKPAGPKRGKS
ncbi:DEAD/DEAH box helicase [Vannielia litorea]|uniref:DEAD/DEAH box helicase n=1 Tax=Vannielia litorea TaxID=1217970 RepID=UPI001C9747C4|nr:DEAD/DEAH box helicase [Vannielia litorea]MBY6152810.1 DEAD/DEAH box helicase [Vannielia litorea]